MFNFHTIPRQFKYLGWDEKRIPTKDIGMLNPTYE